MSKRALITGNAGFVGRHFEDRLTAENWIVHGVDLKYHENALDTFRYTDRYYDLVIHCAAIVGGRKTIDGNPLALASNLQLDAALFEWALRSKPRRVVYFSSSAAYPVHKQADDKWGRLKESDIDPSLKDLLIGVPDQLYGWAKLTGENLAWRAKQEGLKVSVVRPFSGYGEDQDESYPFPKFIDRALRREDPFQIWGDGRQVRDFIHIDDIVNAVMVMVRDDIDGPVNLGSGNATALRDLATMVCHEALHYPDFTTVPAAPSGVPYRVCDPAKMLEFYRPSISLEEGIARALEYRNGSHL